MRATIDLSKPIYYRFITLMTAILLIFFMNGTSLTINAKVPEVKPKNVGAASYEVKQKNKIKDESPTIDMDKLAKLLVYPESAKKAGKEGNVILKVKVSEKGLPFEVTVVKSSDKVFTQPAVNAMKKMDFKPLTRNGVPVEYEFKVPVKFKLK